MAKKHSWKNDYRVLPSLLREAFDLCMTQQHLLLCQVEWELGEILAMLKKLNRFVSVFDFWWKYAISGKYCSTRRLLTTRHMQLAFWACCSAERVQCPAIPFINQKRKARKQSCVCSMWLGGALSLLKTARRKFHFDFGRQCNAE